MFFTVVRGLVGRIIKVIVSRNNILAGWVKKILEFVYTKAKGKKVKFKGTMEKGEEVQEFMEEKKGK